ncbi:SH3 domain-containing protein [Pseudoduganella lurida]|nr:SH3 domain-containing protein [Pseudoduganella lurida]
MLTALHGVPAYALGLVLTLILAAHLTPAHWWRRPTARGAAVLGGGTWAGGALLLYCFATAPVAPVAAPLIASDVPEQQTGTPPPAAGARYRVYRDLNVRGAAGVGAARLAVVPQGALVAATGAHEGDWWQITYASGTSRQTGWASSLWLRRPGERENEQTGQD